MKKAFATAKRIIGIAIVMLFLVGVLLLSVYFAWHSALWLALGVGAFLVVFVLVAVLGAIQSGSQARIVERVHHPDVRAPDGPGEVSEKRVVAEGVSFGPPSRPFAVDLYGHARRPFLSPGAAARIDRAHALIAENTAALERRLRSRLWFLVGGDAIVLCLGFLASGRIVIPNPVMFVLIPTVMYSARLWQATRRRAVTPSDLLPLHLGGSITLGAVKEQSPVFADLFRDEGCGD